MIPTSPPNASPPSQPPPPSEPLQVSSPHNSLTRSDAQRWRLLGNRLLAFLGAAFLAAALIFFFAYNWADLHRFGKFAVGFVGFLTAVAFACFRKGRSQPIRDSESTPQIAVDAVRFRAALFAAALCIGALLALLGQVYQTGADLWQLFALWALLALPFALLSRGVETWLLWIGVANTALVLWLKEGLWLFGHFDEFPPMLLCAIAFNSACLLLAERFAYARLFTPNRALPRIAALLVLGGLCTGACAGVYSNDFTHFIPLFIAGSVLALALYRHYRFDLVMLAMSGTGAITFGTIALGKLVSSGGGRHAWELVAVSCATFLIVSSGLFIAWLLQLHRDQKPQKPAASAQAPEAPPAEAIPANPAAAVPINQPTTASAAIAQPQREKAPIWLSILQGIAAWIAASMLASSLAAPFWLFKGGSWLIAGVFIAGAIILFYKVRGSVFFDQAALSLSLAGQGLLCASVIEQWDDIGPKTTFTFSLVVALALFALRTTLLHRTLCLIWAATCLYLIAEPGYATHVLFGLGFSAATILLWLNRPGLRTDRRSRWAAHNLSAYVLSVTHASSLIAWAFLGWNYFYFHLLFWKTPEVPRDIALLYSTGSAALLVGLVAWLCRPLYANPNAPERAKKQSALLISAAGLFAALAYRDPALVLCAALLLATYAARERAWFTAMLVALPILIWQLYYSFEQTLIMRSLTLAGSGALLLGLRKAVALLDREETDKSATALPKPRTSFEVGLFQRGVATAAALILALCLWGIWSNERILAHGQPVLVKLAPVDPRSLMQGDYVALAYELDGEIHRSHDSTRRDFDEARKAPLPSYAYLTLDEKSRIAALHSTGTALAPLPEGATLALKLRHKNRWPRIGPNAFFFQEGQGKLYETAKWAELRVDASGKALLLNLRDETFEILGETKR